MVTRIQIAKPDIVQLFETMPPVLTNSDVRVAFQEHREFWRLAKNMTLKGFVAFMLEKTNLSEVRFDFPQRPVSGFVWGEVPLLELLLGVVQHSFYSHYTAMRIHGLTEQVPKTVYLSREKQGSSAFNAEHREAFEQAAIDAAFSRPPRASQNEVTVGDIRVLLLTGAPHDEDGVTSGNVNLGDDRSLKLRFTRIERTLIDISVRPFYAGGIAEVAKAFENAKAKGLSVNAMAAMLKRMSYAYPYHQAIGFYLERAGYKPSQLDLFRRIPMERDFYLAHQMGNTRYVKDWRLHVPETF